MNIKIKQALISTKYFSVIAATVVFVIAFVFGSAMFRGFFDFQTFFNLFIDKSFLLVSAMGMSLVILSGGIDLSVGSVLALTAMIISSLTEINGVNPGIAVFIALVTGTLIGLSMGLIIACWNVPPFIATLAGMFFARGACYIISIKDIVIHNPVLYDLALWKFHFGGLGFISFGVIISLVVVGVIHYISLYTKLGRNIYAIGGNESSALLMGIPVKKAKIIIYTINGLCSSIAGVVFSLYMLSGYGLHGLGMELDVIAAVVIGGTLLAGGTGYVYGSILGVLNLGIIQSLIMFQGKINSWWTKIFVGVLLLLFIGLQRVIVSLGERKKA